MLVFMIRAAKWVFFAIALAIAAIGVHQLRSLGGDDSFEGRVGIVSWSAGAFAVAISAFAAGRVLARGVRSETSPVRSAGNTVALAGFSVLALLYGFVSMSDVPESLLDLSDPDVGEISRVLESDEGRRALFRGAIIAAICLVFGFLILGSAGLRRWGWHGLSDKDLGREYVYMFVFTFVVPGLLLSLLIGSLQLAGEEPRALPRSLIGNEIYRLVNNIVAGVLWILLGAKALIHFSRTHHRDHGDNAAPTPHGSKLHSSLRDSV